MNFSSTILSKYTTTSIRSKNVISNIFNSFLLKGGSVVISFLQVPLTINSLNSEQYGVWMTLFSLITWFNMMDLGLGNGFRNKFTKAIALDKWVEARKYNSSFYLAVAIISLLMCLFFLVAKPYLNWYKLLNVSPLKINNLSQVAEYIIFLFLLQFVLKNIITVLLASHKATQSNLAFVLNNFVSLVVVYVLVETNSATFMSVAMGFMLSQVLVYFLFSIYAYGFVLKKTRPKVFDFNLKYIKEISASGLQFFVIQIAVILLYNSGNILVSHLFSPSEVVPYNVSNRLFTSTQFIFTILMTPLWSAFTDSYTKQDFDWIKNSVKNIVFVWFFYAIILSIVLVFSKYIYDFWIGHKIDITFAFSLQMFVYTLLINWTSIFSYFVNSIGKIKLQMYIAVIQAFLNIPMSIFFVKFMHWGPWSIMLSVNLLLLIPAVILPVQYLKIINKKDYGIWAK